MLPQNPSPFLNTYIATPVFRNFDLSCLFTFLQNNNDNDNNNNNLFNSNNKSERKRAFSQKNTTSTTAEFEDEMLIKALRNRAVSPWSWELFELIRKREPSSMKLMHHWLYLVTRAYPKCMQILSCEFFSTFR